MRRLTRALRQRLVPALLTAAGVTLIGAGLAHYGTPVQADPFGQLPAPTPLATINPSFLAPSLPPVDGSPPPSAQPSADPVKRVATPVVIEQLGIDLPIIAQPNDNYPYCNVAMRLKHAGLGQPGSGKSVYLYAH